MQFSGLHKLVNAKKAPEQHKTAKKTSSSISASSVSEQYSKEKAKIDNDPYATALNIINKKQHDAVPDLCTSVEMRSVEENKSANSTSDIKNTHTNNAHEQELVRSPTEMNDSNSYDRLCKKQRLEMEAPLNESNVGEQKEIKLTSSHSTVNLETYKKTNTSTKEHTTSVNGNDNNSGSISISSSSETKVMTKNEVDELRHAAIVNLTKIVDETLLELMTNYNNTNTNNNINACEECKVHISDDVIIELLSQFISEHDLTIKQGASDNKCNTDILQSDKLSRWMMTNDDKREFELLYCITKTVHLDGVRSQKAINEAKEYKRKVDDDESANHNKIQSAQKMFQLEKLISILWFLLACSWCHDLDPSYDLPECPPSVSVPMPVSVPAASSINLAGWSYELYLFSIKQFEAINAVGSSSKSRLVAEAHKHWVDAQRSRRCVLEMILYLTCDLQYLRKVHCQDVAPKPTNSVITAAATATRKESDAPLQILPTQLREGLESLFINEIWRNRNFVQARQVYVDLTMGNANWELGLFSAGEVHMRRSIERVERNRVRSLLNNEKAMILMHSLRQLIHFAERELPRMPNCHHAFYNSEKQVIL